MLHDRVIRLNVTEAVHQVAKNRAEKPAIVFGRESKTYGQLWNEIETVSAALSKTGLNVAVRVALLLPNSPEFVIAFFSVQAIGGVAAPMNSRLPPDSTRSVAGELFPKKSGSTSGRLWVAANTLLLFHLISFTLSNFSLMRKSTCHPSSSYCLYFAWNSFDIFLSSSPEVTTSPLPFKM